MIAAFVGVVATVVAVAASFVVGRRGTSRACLKKDPSAEAEASLGEPAALPQDRASAGDEPAALPQVPISTEGALNPHLAGGDPLRGSPSTGAQAAAQVQDHVPAARGGPNADAQRSPPLRHQRLLDCLRQMPLATRDMLELYYWHDLTAKELGQIIGVVSPQTVKARLAKARRDLRRCVGEPPEPPPSASAETSIESQLREIGKFVRMGRV